MQQIEKLTITPTSARTIPISCNSHVLTMWQQLMELSRWF